MNILICCEFFYPSIGGAQKVCEELASNFVEEGHKVTVATSQHLSFLKKKETFKKKIKIIRFQIKGNAVRGFVGNIKEYQNFILKNKFDAVLLYAAQQWSFDLVLPVIKNIKSNLYFAPCGFSKLNNFFYRDYFRNLPKYLKYFKSNILHSNEYRDSKYFLIKKIKNKIVIPNASDMKITKKKSKKNFSQDKKLNFLNVSNIRFAKGQDLAILIFFFLNLKINMKLYLIGEKNCSKIYLMYLNFLKFFTEFFWKNKSIIFRNGRDRRDVKESYLNSDIFLFTSRIECSPLVLFESASAGLPFISLKVGNSSEIAKWTGAGVVFENIFQISKSIKNLILNENKMKKMSKNGKKNCNKEYNWRIISKRYLKLFQKNNIK